MVPNDELPAEAKDPSGDNKAFGFDNQPKRERYNTQFLVAQMSNEDRRAKLIILGLAVGIMVAIGLGLSLSSKAPEALPEQPVPAASKTVPPKAPAKAPAEKTP